MSFYQSTPRIGCGGYDYNCDSVETKGYTAINAECPPQCYDDQEEGCMPTTGLGWEGSAPACGASNEYITNVGTCEWVGGEEGCGDNGDCETEWRAQKCR